MIKKPIISSKLVRDVALNVLDKELSSKNKKTKEKDKNKTINKK